MLKIRNANGQPGHRKYAGEVPMKYCGCRGARLCLGGVWPVPGKVAVPQTWGPAVGHRLGSGICALNCIDLCLMGHEMCDRRKVGG